ncbi:polyprotein [Rhynchospora pubera]|uniref:Polyprotein n=1 Tax=Rhynchospora pubera TaxID=906938 RepID=A0AAV8EAF7_9POAL|nr:polyprotein [Rhynchospora pubera]
MISHASIPHMFWDEIFSTAVYLINRLPSSTNNEIPYTTLFNSPSDYNFLRVVGCLCFPHTRQYNSNKLQLRSLPCVFLGYATNQKGYRCLHIDTNRIFTSRSVQFDEQAFFFSKNLTSNGSSTNSQEEDAFLNNTALSGPPLLDLYLRCIRPTSPQPTMASPPQQAQPQQHDTQPNITPHNSSKLPLIAQLLNSAPDHAPSSDRTITPLPLQLSSPQPQQTSNSIIPTAPPPSSHPMVTRTRDNTRKTRHFPDHVAFLTSLANVEPTSFTQANNHQQWRMAMAKEIDALAVNQTWQLVPPPHDQKVIGCKWVFKIKRHSDGTIERHKARLVAKGYHQQEGIDVFDTFSPVVRPTTVRLVLSLAVSSHWAIHQLDVQNAFLHGDLSERIYMTQPPGFIDSNNPDHVCLLKKSIYGLKQSPRAWFQKLSTALVDFGFTASHYDPSLFFAHCKGHTIIVLIYVDDILITGSSQHLVTSCISQLHSRFAIKDLGLLHYFLGIAVTSSSHGLHLSRSKYIKDILQRTNMMNAKLVATPIATGVQFLPGDSVFFSDPHLYKSTIGALQYVTVTRPDLSYAINRLSQFMHAPTVNHWTAVKRVLRYLVGTLDQGLQFYTDSAKQLHAYTDNDWAGCQIDRRSTSGYCIFLGHNLLSWSAKKQHTVSRSSTEAEYRSLALTCTELLWIQFLLQELQVPFSTPPIMWCDNIGATFLAANLMFHSRTKHVEIDFHFIREKVVQNQLVDIMTKPLSITRFNWLKHKLNVTSIPLACGGGGVKCILDNSSNCTVAAFSSLFSSKGFLEEQWEHSLDSPPLRFRSPWRVSLDTRESYKESLLKEVS